MQLRSGLPVYLFLGFLLLCLFSEPLFPHYIPAQTGDFYFLINSRIVYVTAAGIHELKIKGDIIAIFQADGGVYYIRRQDNGYFAGYYPASVQGAYECGLKHELHSIKKFTASNKIFYILFTKNEGKEGPGDLVRFDPDAGRVDTLRDVNDFCLSGGSVCILKDGALNFNGSKIPLMIEGDLCIKEVLDERLVFVSNGSETEACDIVSGRNFYQYADDITYPAGEDFNLILEFIDSDVSASSADGEDKLVYYNIIINGYEDERTQTAPGRVVKTSYIKLEPGMLYLVKAERWELDRQKGKYVRANNIMQPGEIKIYIPENRGVKIIIEFNGSGYMIKKGIYRGDKKAWGDF